MWTCGKCGAFVPNGNYHACPSYAAPYQPPSAPPVPPPDARNRDLLEVLLRIEALLKKLLPDGDGLQPPPDIEYHS